MVAVLRQWQEVERKTVSILTEIMEKSQNPFVGLLMEIIRQDSLTHHRVQQFLIDSVTVSAPSLSREELAEVWDMIEKHDAGEKQALELAQRLLQRASTPSRNNCWVISSKMKPSTTNFSSSWAK